MSTKDLHWVDVSSSRGEKKRNQMVHLQTIPKIDKKGDCRAEDTKQN